MDTSSIIIADENALLRKYLRMNLQGDPNFWVIDEAGDGLELLDLLNETTPDVIVSDVSLANLSGLEAAKIIKEQHSQVKIVILTAELCINKYHAANKIGVDGYILKNEIENITYIINNILRGMTYISSYFQERTRDN